ncbi:MAG: signal peptidase II [Clostridiaceae bacterium]|jgi:signal peptidase II|nr:signal peptidase II [Clostridiaceae bacterium]
MEMIMIIVLIMLDQWTKGLAERLIGSGKPVTVIAGFFEISCLANKGAAWSIFSSHNWGLVFLIILSSIVLFALLWFLRKAGDRRAKAVLILLIAGSAGNLIDRLRAGAVTDFLSFTFGSYAFPTFNLADAMITVGTGLLILFSLMDRHFLSIQFGTGYASSSDKEKKKDE